MIKGNVREPNFLIGGTAAAGTSFLSAILVQHPEIYLPRKMRPEPHFFYKSWEFEKGLNAYLENWFDKVPSESIAVGERSSSYLFGGSEVAKKIATYYPNMRFVFTLRNPVERTWANYRYTVLEGLETLDFEEALLSENQRILEQQGIWAEIQPYNYTGRGYYARQLQCFFDLFPAENILILKSEDLAADTDRNLSRIYDFLRLETKQSRYVRPPNHTSVNVLNASVQAELREQLAEKFDEAVEAVRQQLDFRELNFSVNEYHLLNKLQNNLTASKIEMPTWAKKYLTNLFKEDMADLRNLVDFDISDWIETQ